MKYELPLAYSEFNAKQVPVKPYQWQEWLATGIGLGGAVIMCASLWTNGLMTPVWMWTALFCMMIGIIGFSVFRYEHSTSSTQNHDTAIAPFQNRNWIAWALALILTAFYVLLYFYPQHLGLGKDGAGNQGLIAFFDPLSQLLKGKPASEWFVYGVLYSVAVFSFGFRFIIKHRHSRYQILRTCSLIFFQCIIAFLLPEILQGLNLPYNDFKNMWPLNYYFFDGWHIDEMRKAGNYGMFVLVWGIALILVISPVLTYFYGKRWYCSWVCGCGGLAETAGDPFRHLSNKSQKAWVWERRLIYPILVFAILMTGGVIYSYVTGAGTLLGISTSALRQWYGFLIGACFSGVIGVGFYPLMGGRVWCRFGCPMAAILGLQQKYFSRFRITSNPSQCISCGNCSTYCEMGIDVRHYAQQGLDIKRASCVGCGLCAEVCPRGVLRLES